MGSKTVVTVSQVVHPSSGEYPDPPYEAPEQFGPWVGVSLWNPHDDEIPPLGSHMTGVLAWTDNPNDPTLDGSAPYLPPLPMAVDETRYLTLGTYYGNINAFVAGWITGQVSQVAGLGDNPSFKCNYDEGQDERGNLEPLVMEFLVPDPNVVIPPTPEPEICPESTWPYMDPGVSASPGPTGVARAMPWR